MLIEVINKDVFDIDLPDTRFTDEHFSTEPFENDEILIFFNPPNTTCIASLVADKDLILRIRDTDIVVGRLIK